MEYPSECASSIFFPVASFVQFSTMLELKMTHYEWSLKWDLFGN